MLCRRSFNLVKYVKFNSAFNNFNSVRNLSLQDWEHFSLKGVDRFTPEEEFTKIGEFGKHQTIFSDSAFVEFMQDCLYYVYDIPGMDWTKIILLGTFAIRTFVSFPLIINQRRMLARLENIQPKFKELAEDLKKEMGPAIRKYKWDEKEAKRRYKYSFKHHWRKLIEQENCHPLRSVVLPLLQVPLWICFSSALRNVVYMLPDDGTDRKLYYWTQIRSENFPWLDSLVYSDPLVFPIILTISNFANLKIHTPKVKNAAMPKSTLQKVVPFIIGGAFIGLGILAMVVPGAVSMYWATSSVFALSQNMLLKRVSIRKFFKIPSTPSNP